MRTPRSLIGLTALNLILLAVLLVQQFRPVFAEDQPPVLRGRGLQIVDSQGRIRASISVLAPEKASGSEQSETVLLRSSTRSSARKRQSLRSADRKDWRFRAELRVELRRPDEHQGHLRDSASEGEHELTEATQ